MTEIYDSLDHVLILSGYGNPEMHLHQAAHILLSPVEIEVKTNQESLHCKGALIPSQTMHTVDAKGIPMLVFMFDETTAVADSITHVEVLEDTLTDTILSLYQKAIANGMDAVTYHSFVQSSLELLQLKTTPKVKDSRILEAMAYVNTHISDSLKEEDVAALCCLSESRFSHLFKEETGITFKGYVILRRLDYVYTRLSQGVPITIAALDAGFSDSAHFASVNKRMFGLSATAITSDLHFHRML